jgi:WD40 repeat protein
VAYSPDGRLVAIGISGQSQGEFPPRPHPNPRKCAVVQWFDLASQKRLRRIETFGDLTRVAFSPDGELVAAARLYASNDGIELNEVRVWETATGRLRWTFDRCHDFTFAPHQSEIVVVSRKRCVVIDSTSGARLREFPPLADALRVAHADGGRQVCAIVRVDAGFVLRSCEAAAENSHRESRPLSEPFYSLALPANGTKLATGHAGGVVQLWDMARLQPVGRVATGNEGRAFPFFSASGDLLGAADQSNSDVVIWETATGREVSRFTFRQGSLHTFLAKGPQRVVRPEEDPIRFVFSPDETAFLGGPFGGIVRLVHDGRDIARFGD